ncbi:1-acyl-sn-glycerol-3-phosphate acyltransferase [Candidatus Peregrinibacteria bacterium]|nr:1-acyl-sn-glycerol-3-phosphate acyltransferase [Candidatus Peregrinibacteria bacterium]
MSPILILLAIMHRVNEMSVPDFSVNSQEARAYIEASADELCERLNTTKIARERFINLFLDSYEAYFGLENKNPTPHTPEGRKLTDGISELLVQNNSELIGKEHYDKVKQHMDRGGNVLLIQNHTSIADMLVMEALMRRFIDSLSTEDWAYITGGPIADPKTIQGTAISGGYHRFNVHSEKALSKLAANPAELKSAKHQNISTIRALYGHAMQGGKLVVVYPEGTRNDGIMERAKPFTTLIPSTMTKEGCPPLLVLPTYMYGANKILPVARNDKNEFSTQLQKCNRRKADMTIGQPINWSDIISHAQKHEIIRTYISSKLVPEGVNKDNTKELVSAIAADIMGGMIANINLTSDHPNSNESDGKYGIRLQRVLMAQFLASVSI